MTAFEPLEPDWFDAVIFDLGGVVLELDYGQTISRLSALGGRDASELYGSEQQVETFDRFERGELSAPEFRSWLRHELSFAPSVTDEQMDDAWNAILGRVPEAHLRLLAALRSRYRTFLLSNTNEIHIARFFSDYRTRHEAAHGPFASLFAKDYYSHLLGLRKPDRAVYERILELEGLSVDRTLFIDDNPANIAGAAALGLVTRHHPRNAPLAPYFPWLFVAN